mmetsp:Transcript_2639/g.3957  ORF Transcript_2639/g.3957 Transcript_2639/m.3957 type:complete len:248 (+) Transcript_2639:47-790(+)
MLSTLRSRLVAPIRTSWLPSRASKRLCTTSPPKGVPGVDAPRQMSFIRKVTELYIVLLGANFISNALIHPTAKIDYGILNKLYWDNREVDSPFWGTRLPHLFMIPASLAFYDIVVTSVFVKYFGLVSFAATPAPFLLNLYCYTWLAVGSYIAVDAAFNPAHNGKRVEQVTSHLKPLTIGMGLQWHVQMMVDMFGSFAAGPIALLRNAFAVSLVFLPVKALGFGDMGEAGLSPHERKMNGLPPKEQVH